MRSGLSPHKLRFIVAELPKTVSGKIVKRELRDRFSNDES